MLEADEIMESIQNMLSLLLEDGFQVMLRKCDVVSSDQRSSKAFPDGVSVESKVVK